MPLGADQRADRDQHAQAGTSSEMKASDSPKASANTIGAAQASWSAHEVDDRMDVVFEGGDIVCGVKSG